MLTETSTMDERALKLFLRESGLSLTPDEVRMIERKLGRDPTITELHIFNIEWSEHCSYKSSKHLLKQLPTKAPNVILGPSEDAGIIRFTQADGHSWGIALRQESHNHPSHIVPYEGAATGIGGIVRDILCMGAKVIGIADPLRFGDPKSEKTKYIASTVIDGIAGYGNAIGIPNLGGDVCFAQGYQENCLVNVAAIGLVREDEIIHSKAPKGCVGYDIILVGKATDNSGFGGAAFASLVMDEDDENTKSAVQVPDPFLKNVIIRSTYAVFERVRAKGIDAGFKDCGAGGIMCATSELASGGGVGAHVYVERIPTSMELPPFITACSETQERMIWIVPPSFTPTVLKIYNEQFELPTIAQGAAATVIGKIIEEEEYILTYNGEQICHAPVKEVTEGVSYERPMRARARDHNEPQLAEPEYAQALLAVLHHPNVASKKRAYSHYDLEVQGNTIIRAGAADAGVIKPLESSDTALAMSSDCNPRYCRIDPYHGAVNAVAECMRNLAAVGATPAGFTNCLNFGSPENPEVMHDFAEAIRGITDACTKIPHKEHGGCVPIISGNVSFYNESSSGAAIDPSPHITGLGIMPDYRRATTVQVKGVGNTLCLIGPRRDELGGSIYYATRGELGANIPTIDFAHATKEIHTVIDLIQAGHVKSCHDISDGGLAACIAEMLLGADGDGTIGAHIDLPHTSLSPSKLLFSETGGFVLEIEPGKLSAAQQVCRAHGVELIELGTTTQEPRLRITYQKKELFTIENATMADAWLTGFVEAIE